VFAEGREWGKLKRAEIRRAAGGFPHTMIPLGNQSLTASFPPSLTSARQARDFVANGLGAEVDEPGLAERLSLCTSELVTNAVVHAQTDIGVRLVIDATDIWLEVTDEAPARPSRAPPSRTNTRGRGLVLVDALANEWGVADLQGSVGKMVWVRISR
jgi:anti-sigma regulatory factor (Ser/Thr protein kinase)